MTTIDAEDRGISRPRAGVGAGAPWVAMVLIASLAVPLSFAVGPVRLSPYRVVLLAALAPALIQWASGRAGGVRGFDVCLVLAFAWAAMALLVVGPVGAMVEPAGILLVEGLGGYFVTRTYIRSRAEYERVARFFLWLIAALFPFALFEALTGRPILIELAGRLGDTYTILFQQKRLGLERAQVVFDHSIPYGAFVSAGFALALYLYARPGLAMARAWHVGIVGLSAVFSVSAGAIVAVAFQVGLWIWDRITAAMGLPRRWLVLGLGFAALYVAADLASDRRPAHLIVSYMSFSVESGYNRILIFNYGMENVAANPVFGLGLRDWVRPAWMGDSVDNFWLLLAMRHGIPMFVLFTAGVAWLMLAVGYRRLGTVEMRQARCAFMFSLAGMILAGLTVHYWNALFVFFMLLLGSGVWIAYAPEEGGEDAPGPAPEVPGGSRYTRFAPRPGRRAAAPRAPGRPVQARRARGRAGPEDLSKPGSTAD